MGRPGSAHFAGVSTSAPWLTREKYSSSTQPYLVLIVIVMSSCLSMMLLLNAQLVSEAQQRESVELSRPSTFALLLHTISFPSLSRISIAAYLGRQNIYPGTFAGINITYSVNAMSNLISHSFFLLSKSEHMSVY